jgi:hypothetical protein
LKPKNAILSARNISLSAYLSIFLSTNLSKREEFAQNSAGSFRLLFPQNSAGSFRLLQFSSFSYWTLRVALVNIN